MKKIILDTNFLVDAVQYKIDINTELQRICNFKYRLIIIDKTREELHALKSKSAKLALALLDKLYLKEIKSKKYVDDAIIEIIDENYVVATQDKILKERVKSKDVALIIIRQKKYLQTEGL